MIETKLVEIRDEGTTIIALALRFTVTRGDNSQEDWALRHAGYASDYPTVLLAQIAGDSGRITCDPYDWGLRGSRTMSVAHHWLEEHFDELEPAGVVDVEYLLGIRKTPKRSDRWSEVA